MSRGLDQARTPFLAESYFRDPLTLMWLDLLRSAGVHGHVVAARWRLRHRHAAEVQDALGRLVVEKVVEGPQRIRMGTRVQIRDIGIYLRRVSPASFFDV